MTSFPPLNSVKFCPKCGRGTSWKSFSMVYRPATSDGETYTSERIERTCQRCGARWCEACEDAGTVS